jgi:hypothetical protein
VSTIGVVEEVMLRIPDAETFIKLCRKRSVFTDAELLEHWNYTPGNRPFIVNFLYSYSFPKRPNMAKLIELGVIKGVDQAPRGFERLSREQFNAILKESNTDDRYVVD